MIVILTCPECDETSDVRVAQSNGATDLLPDWCFNCQADLGPAYDSGEFDYA